MKKPISEFLSRYEDVFRFHMPGHSGKLDINDITEINGADVLYKSNGIIKESENIISKLYGSGAVLYSASGSTLCIQTIVGLLRGKIAADRGCHASFANAVSLWGRDVHWLIPQIDDDTDLILPITPEQVENALTNDSAIKNVFITSPTYYGKTADVKKISEICIKHNAKLCVDNAHGAHLAISGKHPIQQGADFCCDSVHKTLCSLTGAAILHLKDSFLYHEAKSIMAMFGTSSPSYPILASIETGVEYLFESYSHNCDYAHIVEHSKFAFYSFDPHKLLIDAYSNGYTGFELAKILRNNKRLPETPAAPSRHKFPEVSIEPEFVTKRYVLLICTEFVGEQAYTALKKALNVPTREPIFEKVIPIAIPKKGLECYDAIRVNSEYIDVDNADGIICAENLYKCPPGQLLTVAGEIINQQIIENLKENGIKTIKTVDSSCGIQLKQGVFSCRLFKFSI